MTTDSKFIEVVSAIHAGDVPTLKRILADNPGLAAMRLGGIAKGRTPLHVVADWPGYFPNGPQVVRILIEAGADPNARDPDLPSSETPLHWAASSDDVDVACALIDGGANLETPNGSIGTPLDNAIGYACWHVARLLVRRGAKVNKLWHAAALGMLDRLEELLGGQSGTDSEALSQAFWHACAAGQRRAAELLLNRGADLNWVPAYAKGTPLDARPVASGLGRIMSLAGSATRALSPQSSQSDRAFPRLVGGWFFFRTTAGCRRGNISHDSESPGLQTHRL